MRLAGKSRATLQTPDLAEAFLALGMRNGWKYLIANLTVSLKLLSTRLWMAKEIALTINRKPPNKILGTNLVSSTIPCKFGVGREEVWVQWWVRLTKGKRKQWFVHNWTFFLAFILSSWDAGALPMCVNLFFIIVWREEAYNSTRNNGKNVDKKSA